MATKSRKSVAATGKTYQPAGQSTEQIVRAYGTIRVMGRSGDAPVRYPCIESLDALGQLPLDEQRAVAVVQELIAEARREGRAVMAVTPPAHAGEQPLSRSLQPGDFPFTESELVIVPAICGGAR